MTDEKNFEIKSWISSFYKKIYRRDVIVGVFIVILALFVEDIYNFVGNYFKSPELKIAYSFSIKEQYTSTTSDSTNIITYIYDTNQKCVPISMKKQAVLDKISGPEYSITSIGFVVANIGKTKATDIKITFNLAGPGETFSLNTTPQVNATLSNIETPVIGRDGQLIKIDNVYSNSYEVIVVNRIDSTSSFHTKNSYDDSQFRFYSFSYSKISESIIHADEISYYEIARAASYKFNSNILGSLNAKHRTHEDSVKVQFYSNVPTIASTCVEHPEGIPWFEKNGISY